MTIILICGDNGGQFQRAAASAMYVCLCNGVTDREIREVAAAGCRTLPELTMRTGCGATCGSCLDMAQQILDEVHAARALDVPVLDHGLSQAA